MYKKQFELIKTYKILNVSKYEMTISLMITLHYIISLNTLRYSNNAHLTGLRSVRNLLGHSSGQCCVL